MCIPEILFITVFLSFCIYILYSNENITDNYMPTSKQTLASKIANKFKDNSQQHKKIIIGGRNLPMSDFGINNDENVQLIQYIKEHEKEEEEEEEEMRLARNKKDNARDTQETD